MGVILGGSLPGGSYPRWELSWVGIFQVGVILGGNFSWLGFSRWELSGGESSRWEFSGSEFSLYLFPIRDFYYPSNGRKINY